MATGVDDALEDGSRNYFVELEADGGNRSYETPDPELRVYLANKDDEQPPQASDTPRPTSQSRRPKSF